MNESLQNLKTELPNGPSKPSPVELKSCKKTPPHLCYCNTVHSSPAVSQPGCPPVGAWGGTWWVHSAQHSRVFFSHKEEQNHVICRKCTEEEVTVLTEIRQIPKCKYCILSVKCTSWKIKWHEIRRASLGTGKKTRWRGWDQKRRENRKVGAVNTWYPLWKCHNETRCFVLIIKIKAQENKKEIE